jgi:hypothetical protein
VAWRVRFNFIAAPMWSFERYFPAIAQVAYAEISAADAFSALEP